MSHRGKEKFPVSQLKLARDQKDQDCRIMLSQIQMFPMQITDKSIYSKENFPRPFPKLTDCFNAKNPSDNLPRQRKRGNNNKTSSSTSVASLFRAQANKIDKGSPQINFVISKPNPANIARKRPTGYVSTKKAIPVIKPIRTRPATVPHAWADRIVRSLIPIFEKSCSSERLKKLHKCYKDDHTDPDDKRDKWKSNIPLPTSIPSKSMNTDKASQSDLFNATKMTETNVSTPQIFRNRSSHSVHQDGGECEDSSMSLESSGDLINKGMELLTIGQDIIETSRKAGRMEAQTLQEVAETLYDVVNGELRSLKEQNEALRTANHVLQKQLIAFTKIAETFPIDTTKCQELPTNRPTTLPTLSNSLHVLCNAAKDLHKEISTQTQMETEPKLCKEAIARISVLEKTIGYLFGSHAKQTANLQDRLFTQELRYEETLEKFEDVIANMTNMFAGLQTTYNNLHNTNSMTDSTKEFTEALHHIVKISPSKKVQFKGILKSEYNDN